MDTNLQYEEAAGLLMQNPDYKVLRRLKQKSVFTDPLEGEVLTGIILDVETTGLDPEVDEIIELAMIKFSFSKAGKVGRVLDIYQSLNQPSASIPEAITRLTGIGDTDVIGQSISATSVEKFVSDCVLIVAHNAAFDRGFSERVSQVFAEKAWACSATEIPWRNEGIVGSRLEYIAQSYNYFFSSHRALDDCNALLALLTFDLPRSNATCLSVLLDNARRLCTRVYAVGAPYESRAVLKRRGYRWSDGQTGYPRAWWKDFDLSVVEEEIAFLKRLDVSIAPSLFRMSAKERFRRNAANPNVSVGQS